MSSRYCLQEGIYLILGVFIWILILPFLLLSFVPLLVFRLFVHFLANIFRPDLIPITNLLDNVIISGPSSSFHVKNCSQIWELKKKLDILKFREHFHNVFLSSPELREKYGNLYCYYVQWGLYCFKKAADEINLEERIKECKLIGGEKELEELVGKFVDTNDYGEKPNWEILLIHVQQSSKEEGLCKTVMVFKLDHGLGDGYTIAHLVERLTGINSPYLVKEKHWSSLERVSTSFLMTISKILVFL
jgi:hypothetical protein